MKAILSGGEPFFIPGNQIGCLLVHGFTGAPKEMRWLGEHLAADGYTVLGVRLFGHATDPEDMIRSRWRDWVASVEDGYHVLSGISNQIVVMGLSIGAVLTLYISGEKEAAGLVAMSCPYETPDSRVRLLRPVLPFLSTFWRFADQPVSEWQDQDALAQHLGYARPSVRSAAEVDDLVNAMRERLPCIRVPVLLIHSKGDDSVPMDHAQQIYDQLMVKDKHILWLEKSGHVVTQDAEREVVFRAVSDFVQRVTQVNDRAWAQVGSNPESESA